MIEEVEGIANALDITGQAIEIEPNAVPLMRYVPQNKFQTIVRKFRIIYPKSICSSLEIRR